MRKVDAPPAGWYPDPQQRQRLRWWDGLDWTDIRRAPPSEAELIVAEQNREFFEHEKDLVAAARQQAQMGGGGGGLGRQDIQDVIAEVRNVARSEVDRAAEQFSQRATQAVRGFTPLITQYTNRAVMWIKRLVIIAVVLLLAYFIFQVVVQASFFEWLGDRIDNFTNDEDGLAVALVSDAGASIAAALGSR